MPIVASMGGNADANFIAIIRAIATKELSKVILIE